MEKNNETKLMGVDISEFNGDIDFEELSKAVDFVVIRATFGRYGIDKRFEENVKGAILYNIPFGLYYYSYATSEDIGKTETKFFLDTIKPYKDKITLPCFIDMEDSDGYKENHGNPSNEVLSAICDNACKMIGEQQLFAGIYANLDYFKNKLNKDKIKNWLKWVAWWNEKADSQIDKDEYCMLQYNSKTYIKGVKGYVDVNYCYRDFKRAKDYLEQVARITTIKYLVLLEDITIQYMTCYKWGKFLIDKIYKRLSEPKIKREQLSLEKLKQVIKKEFDFEQKTISFLSYYIYSDILFDKLYNAISED